jgi:hypothetical protein
VSAIAWRTLFHVGPRCGDLLGTLPVHNLAADDAEAVLRLDGSIPMSTHPPAATP